MALTDLAPWRRNEMARGSAPFSGAPRPDPKGHATVLLTRFGGHTALSMARCYAEHSPPGTYWHGVLAALERVHALQPPRTAPIPPVNDASDRASIAQKSAMSVAARRRKERSHG